MTCLLIFLIVKIRPDITFVIIVTVCFAKNLSHVYTKVVKTIFYYIKGLINCNIIYSNEENLLIKGYLNSNWAGNKENYKLILSFIFMLNRGLVS